MNMHATRITTTDSAWQWAMARFETAKREADRYFSTVWRPLSDRLETLAPSPKPDPWLGDEYLAAKARRVQISRAIGEHDAATECERLASLEVATAHELLMMPAPDHRALYWKLDQLLGEGDGRKADEACASWCGEYVDAVMADAHRLLVVA